MKTMFRGIVVCWLACALTLEAKFDLKSYRESLANLTLDESAVVQGASGTDRISRQLQVLSQVESYSGSKDYHNARSAVRQAAKQADTDAEKALWNSLLKELERAEKAYVEALEKKTLAFLGKLAESAMKTKTSEAADELIQEVECFQSYVLSRSGNSPMTSRLQHKVNQARNFLQQLQRYHDAGSDGNTGEQINILNNLIQNPSSYRLVDMDELKTVRNSLVDRVRRELEGKVAGVQASLKQANSVDGYQTLQADLNELYRQYSNVRVDDIQNRISQLKSLVERVVRIYRYRDRGHYKQMLNDLRNLENDAYVDLAVLPESWIAAQEAVALEQIPEAYIRDRARVGARLKAWNREKQFEQDLHAFYSVVDAYYDSLSYNLARNDVYRFKNDLNRLAKMQSAIENGSTKDFNSAAMLWVHYQHPWDEMVDTRYQKLLVRGLEAFHSVSGLNQKLKKNERPSDAIRRLAEEAVAQRNWQQALRYLTFIHDVTRSCHGRSDFENLYHACLYYEQGQLLAGSGETELAIRSYQKILSLSGELLPRKEAMEALVKLRSE